MDRVLRARAFALLALVAAAALALRREWGASAGLAAMGVGVLVLVTERDVPPRLADQATTPQAAALAGLARSLHVQGNGIVLPGNGNEPSSVFLPAGDVSAKPPPAEERVAFHREASGAMGVTLPAPGGGLEQEWAALEGKLPQGAGLEEATLHLRRAFHALALGDDLHVSRARDRVRVAYRPLAFEESCLASRVELAPWHTQGGCPSCSFAAILVARGLGGPVRVVGGGTEGERAYLDLEPAA